MSDSWADFKRKFGAYGRRNQKAGTLVDEIAVQEQVLRNLGRDGEADAMGLQHQTADAALTQARRSGDTTGGYKDLGTVKAQARAAMRDPVVAASVSGMLKAIPPVLDKIEYHLGTDKKSEAKFEKRHTALDTAFKAMSDATPKGEVDALEKSALKLLSDVLSDIYGGDKYMKANIPDYKAAAYKDMLKERYGITAESPLAPGLDKFYEALALVPASHVAHSSLQNVLILTDDDKDASLGDYATLGKRIRVNAAKARSHPTMVYEMGGTKGKVDTFKVTTLHEVAHSIDDKVGIMNNPVGNDFGDWKMDETVDTVADAFWKEMEPQVGATHKAAMVPEIKKALEGTPPVQPGSVPATEWGKAKKLLETCLAVGKDETAWRTMRPVGARCYFQDKKKWRSYSKAAREGLTVRPYQWRSPAEWFAELYAASWMLKKKPSGAINQSAAIYMYRGT